MVPALRMRIPRQKKRAGRRVRQKRDRRPCFEGHDRLSRSFCKDRLDREKAHGKRVFYRRGARSALTSRVVRIRRAGSSPVRQPAGDKRIYHQLLGSGRRCSTIEEVSTAAWPGYPCEGLGDLGCSEAPSSGLSSPWQASLRRAATRLRRAAMWRQSFGNSKRVLHATFSVDCRPSRTSATCGTLTCGQNNMGTLLLTPQPVNHELYHSGSRL